MEITIMQDNIFSESDFIDDQEIKRIEPNSIEMLRYQDPRFAAYCDKYLKENQLIVAESQNPPTGVFAFIQNLLISFLSLFTTQKSTPPVDHEKILLHECYTKYLILIQQEIQAEGQRRNHQLNAIEKQRQREHELKMLSLQQSYLEAQHDHELKMAELATRYDSKMSQLKFQYQNSNNIEKHGWEPESMDQSPEKNNFTL